MTNQGPKIEPNLLFGLQVFGNNLQISLAHSARFSENWANSFLFMANQGTKVHSFSWQTKDQKLEPVY